MIRIEHLEKKFEDVTPIKDISLTINDGEVVSIIGPSGTGKSTLIRCINLLSKPTNGKIFVDDIEVTSNDCNLNQLRKKVGMVFQNFNLFSHLTVLENVMAPCIHLLKWSKQQAYDQAIKFLDMVNMSSALLKYPDELSGGQKQRVAIARTLSMDPDIILFDEPTSALDPTMAGEVLSVIKNLAKIGKTMIIVTHEMQFAKEISTRVVFLDEGIICEDGTPDDIFNNPKKEKTRFFVRKLNVFKGEILSPKFDFLSNASDIDNYCYKHSLDRRESYKIQLLFEEVVQQNLLVKNKGIKIKFIIEYDKVNKESKIYLKCSCKNLVLYDEKNEISYKIIQQNCKDIVVEEIQDDPIYRFLVTITI